jgi:hypothetical protein
MAMAITLWLITALTVVASAATPIRLNAQNQELQNKNQRRYTVTALGTLGGNLSTAAGINNKGCGSRTQLNNGPGELQRARSC